MTTLEKANIKYYEDLKEITSDVNVMKYIEKGEIWSDQYLKENLKSSQDYWESEDFKLKKDLFTWIIVKEGKGIGYLRWKKGSVTNQFKMRRFLHKNYQNKGIGTEAGKLSIQKLCKYYKERYIYSETSYDNIISEKSLIKIGFYFLEKDDVKRRKVFRFDTYFGIFPLLKLFNKYTAKELLEIIKRYKPERIIDDKKVYENRSIQKELSDMNESYFRKLNNEYVIYKFNYDKEGYLFDITDLFSEKCRSKCKFKFLKLSPYDFLKTSRKHITNILYKQKKEVNRENIRNVIYRINKPCTNFKVLFAMAILDYFKPNSWLDLSAGWGDRLISAIAYDIDQYVGIDPSSCMNEVYQNIINELAPSKKDNFKIIQKGSQEVKLDTKFDLVFTSPPFFDFEDYISEETQSMQRFNSYDKWMKEFMFVSVKNAWESLKKSKDLALYIPYEYEGKECFEAVNGYILNELNGKFSGAIYFYWDELNRVRNLYVWKK